MKKQFSKNVILKRIYRSIIDPLLDFCFLLKWRHFNKHNTTFSKNRFHLQNVTVGRETYGPIEVLYDAGVGKLSIGNYCSLATNVKFFLGGEHDYRRISTYPFQTKVYNGIKGGGDKNIDIEVGDDVWIGFDSIILSGTKIGKGSVIGARSIVKGNVPPFSVYVGNKVIKKRFDEEVLKKLESIDFSKIQHQLGDEYEKYCTEIVTDHNIDRIKTAFELYKKYNHE